jgi:chemotaxis signal transduction protein
MAKFLEFLLEDQEYAISVDLVRNISQPHKIAILPQTPKFVLGVTNYRGKILTVIDLKCLLGISKVHSGKHRLTINICTGNSSYALLADHVTGVIDVNPHNFRRIDVLNFELVMLNKGKEVLFRNCHGYGAAEISENAERMELI